jgi:hypothetical protein
MTTRGICKLCLLEKELQDSHFIGRVVYKKLMEHSIRNPQPVVVTSESLRQSPQQLRDYVFCRDCEQLFNRGGESWMHRHIATASGFKLIDLFAGQTPIFDEPDFLLYDAGKIPAVDCSAILEYGAGVFFKSAAHTWKFEDGTTSHIELDSPLTEALRKFVHREGPFPRGMILTVCVSTKTKQFLGVIPPIGMEPTNAEELRYYFHVPGIYYCLIVGNTIDEKMNMLAFNRVGGTRPVLVSDDWAQQALNIIRDLAAGVSPSPKLKEGLKPRH